MIRNNIKLSDKTDLFYNRVRKSIQDINDAYQEAQPDKIVNNGLTFFPRKKRLMDIYQAIMLDNHLSALVQTRKSRVLGEKYGFFNSSDVEQAELLKLFQKRWFYDFIDHSLDSIFYGYSLIELNDFNKNGEISKVKVVERRNTVIEDPYHKVLAKPYDVSGIDYTDPSISDFYIPIDSGGLGLLLKASFVTLIKRKGLTAWVGNSEKFGFL
jgi:hypothetical protein